MGGIIRGVALGHLSREHSAFSIGYGGASTLIARTLIVLDMLWWRGVS